MLGEHANCPTSQVCSGIEENNLTPIFTGTALELSHSLILTWPNVLWYTPSIMVFEDIMGMYSTFGLNNGEFSSQDVDKRYYNRFKLHLIPYSTSIFSTRWSNLVICSPIHKGSVYRSPPAYTKLTFKCPPLSRYCVWNVSYTRISTVAINPASSSLFHSSSEMKMMSW